MFENAWLNKENSSLFFYPPFIEAVEASRLNVSEEGIDFSVSA